MKIHLNIPPNIDKLEVEKYSLLDIPKGLAVYCESLDMILIPAEGRDCWIGFGIHDNCIDTIEDEVSIVEGVLFKPIVSIWFHPEF